jgi:signal peptidase I
VSNHSKSPRLASSALGTIVHVSVGCMLLAIVTNTWLVSGLIWPVIVAGDSMAPTLHGAHRAWTCVECGREFVCDLAWMPSGGSAAFCPHCRSANRANAGTDRSGDRVLVDRSTYCWRGPRHGEIIALVRPDAPHQWCVKRVVALPGEHVTTRLAGGGVEYTLGTDEYYVAGDNRQVSQDSRFWGEPGVPAERIIGRVVFW